MYLKGSKWSVTRRTRRANPFRVIVLLIMIGVVVYINQVVVPVTGPLFVPTNTPTRSPESFITDAESLEKEGKLEPAIKAYRLAIQSNPKNASLYMALSKLLIDTGKYTDAVTESENALIINPNNATAYALRGYAQGLAGDYLPAITSLKKAIELDSRNATAFAYYAEVLAMESQDGKGDLGTMDKAIEASHTAVDLAPNAIETHSARGLILEVTANYADAAKELEAATAGNANIASLHLALGRNYRYLEEYDKAIEEFNKANALNPSDPNPELYISRTYSAVGEFAKAIQYAEQAIKDRPADPSFYASLYGNLGSLYYKNHDYKQAIASLKLTIRGGTDPDGIKVEGLKLDYGRVGEYYYIYGLALARNGDCGEGLQIAQAVIQSFPDDEVAQYNAQEVINICKNLSDNTTATPAANETLESVPTEMPTPYFTQTPNSAATATATPKVKATPEVTATPGA
jgi:tetratricopeptide (TPR) repeat protein